MTTAGPASYFVGHGAPTLPLQDIPAREFLRGLGRRIDAAHGRPPAVLCVSAHWETATPAVSIAARPETIHDFYGFPDELYRVQYAASGAPDMAERAARALESAGFACRRDPAQGLDHGAWVPLSLMWPDADVAVAQIAIQPQLGPAHHVALGRALAPLAAEGVLILASGGAVHNLREIFRPGDVVTETPGWARAFDDWLADRLAHGDEAALTDYRRQAPSAARAHPRDEHLIPLFVALGAAGPGARGAAIHRSFDFGSLSMAAYRFTP